MLAIRESITAKFHCSHDPFPSLILYNSTYSICSRILKTWMENSPPNSCNAPMAPCCRESPLEWGSQYYKVNRCFARYSPRATTTSQPTNRAQNEPAMDKNANFGLNLVVFGQKFLFLLEKLKVFTHITENPPRHLVHIGFWSGIGQNMQKMAIFGPKWPKMQIWTNFGHFWAKKPNFYGSK